MLGTGRISEDAYTHAVSGAGADDDFSLCGIIKSEWAEEEMRQLDKLAARAHRSVQIDARHASSRESRQTTVGLIDDESGEVCLLEFVYTEETGNAWKNEPIGSESGLQRLKGHRSETVTDDLILHEVIMDGCHKLTTIVDTVFEGQGTSSQEVFHTGKSCKNAFLKMVEEFTKSRKRTVRNAEGTVNAKHSPEQIAKRSAANAELKKVAKTVAADYQEALHAYAHCGLPEKEQLRLTWQLWKARQLQHHVGDQHALCGRLPLQHGISADH